MPFHEHLEKANELLERKEGVYACLELRMAIESYVYDIFSKKQSKLPVEIYSRWQPSKIMDEFLKFYPNFAQKDGEAPVSIAFSIEGNEKSNTESLEFKTLAENQIYYADLKRLKKLYHALGSFLHSDASPSRGAIEKATFGISFVKEFIKKSKIMIFDCYHFKCPECKTDAVFSRYMSENKTPFKCHNEDCKTTFIAKINNENNKMNIHLQNKRIKCDKCSKPIPLPISLGIDGGDFICKHCDAVYVYKSNFCYALKP